MPKYQVEVLPDALILLRHELRNHPDILAKLQPAPDMATWLEMLCTELDVLVDGYYSNEDYHNLCVKLINLLRKRGTIHVNTHRAGPTPS